MSVSDTDFAKKARKRSGRGRLRGAAIGLVVCLWLIAPIGAVLAIFVRLEETQLVEAKEVWVPAAAAEVDERDPVSLYLSWDAEFALVAPAWSGTVTSVFIEKDNPVRTGEPVVAIDGVRRVAAALSSPLYRPLLLSTRGEDVISLTTFLANQGVNITPSDRFTRASWREITAWVASLGVDVTRGLADFDPSWLVYLPRESVQIGEVQLSPGMPAPAAGASLATVASRLVSARLLDPEALGVEKSQEGPLDELTLEAASEQLPEGSRLLLGAVDLQIDETRRYVAIESLADVERVVLTDARMATALIESTLEEASATLPVASILEGACVLVSRDGGPAAIERITIVSSNNGLATVRGDVTPQDDVLVNPDPRTHSCD